MHYFSLAALVVFLSLSGASCKIGGAPQNSEEVSSSTTTSAMPDRGDWNIETTAYPGSGYYSGHTSTLGPSDLCSGKSIYGAAGARICETGTTVSPAGAANILSGLEAWDGTGAKMTGAMTNRGPLDASLAFPGSGFYSGTVNNAPAAAQVCSGTNVLGAAGSAICIASAQLASSNAPRDAGVAVLAHLAGQTTSLQITQKAEVTDYAGVGGTPDLPNSGGYNYREIPDMTKDDDNALGTTCKFAQRPTTNCGSSGNIAARIADCVTQNGVNASWDGATQCNRGQATWKLVARKALNKEVWRDERTGLIWSSLVSGGTTNWCKASGNTQDAPVTFYQAYNNSAGTPMTGSGTIGAIAGGGASLIEDITVTFSGATTVGVTSAGGASGCAGTGGSWSGALTTSAGSITTYSKAGVCSFTITQGSVNFAANDKFILKSISEAVGSCAPGASNGYQPVSPVSFCAEAGTLSPAIAGENWSTGVYDDAKGGMGKASTDKIRWRLPTIEDYYVADANGIRLVMPDMGTYSSARPVSDGSAGGGAWEWAATVSSYDRNNAWSFGGQTGVSATAAHSGANVVRCVGR